MLHLTFFLLKPLLSVLNLDFLVSSRGFHEEINICCKNKQSKKIQVSSNVHIDFYLLLSFLEADT